MVKCQVSHSDLQTEETLGVMKDQVHIYQVDILRLIGMSNLRMGVKSLRTHLFDIVWEQRVDLR